MVQRQEDLWRMQQRMASRVMQEVDTDRKLKIMAIIIDLATERNHRVHVEKVLIVAANEGFGDEDVLRTIDELLDLGFITQPEQGFVKRA